MRVFARFVSTVCVAAATLVAQSAPGPAGDAASILTAARQALGGEKKLSAVKTFVATGRTQQVRGDNLVPIEFEIACELPDKYVRKDEIPAQESGPTSTGFNGDALIQIPAAPMPMMPGGAPPGAPGRGGAAAPTTQAQVDAMRASRVNGVKQDFVRLTLGMFAASFASYPLTFSSVGRAEAPQGKAEVVEVKGPANLTLRLFVNTDTHLPIMVSWNLPAPMGRGPAGQPPTAPTTPPPPAPREARIYYADYRDVDGLQFPFRLRRAIAGDTVEETTFDRFRINAKIDPRKFEVPK